MNHTPPNGPARRSRRKVSAALLAAGAVGATTAAIALPTASVTAADGDTVQILSFNDYHGHIEADTAGSIDGQFGGPAAGGGEYLSAKLTELRADFGNDDLSFTVAAGDNIGGSPFFSGLVKDEPSVESLNAMGLDISGVGNHEFDEGVEELLRMQNGGCHPVEGCFLDDYDPDTDGDQEYGGADFQWLAANVLNENGTPDVAADDSVLDLDDGVGYEDLGGYSIVDANGTDIAFIGMTLDGTDELVAASGIEGYRFADEVETANAIVDDLTDGVGQQAEAIFVLLHEGGIPAEFEIDGCNGISGPIVTINEGLDPEIDGVISGHTQRPYNCMLTDGTADGERPVISAWEYGKVVSEMTFDIDGDGDVDRDSLAVVNHPVVQPADPASVQEGEVAADPAITSIIDKWSPVVSALADDAVGEISENITRGGFEGSDRGVESDAGNLIADAQLAGIQDFGLNAQIAFMNPGGIRSDLLFEQSDDEGDGVVTYGEAFTFQPFNNTMIVLPMTGAQIQAVLEEQCQPGDASRPFLHLGVSDGFTYDLAVTTQDGVCTAVDVSNVALNGTALEADTTYNVAVNNFLAEGGDSFDTFAEVTDTTDTGLTDLEVLISYFENQGVVGAPGTDRVNETLTSPQVAVTPVRLLDSREGDEFPTSDGLFEGIGRLAADETVRLDVLGRGGVPSSAGSVNIQVGAILPDGDGFLTVYPCSEDRPLASSINFNGAPVVSNAITSLVGDDGDVCIYTKKAVDLYVDINAYGGPDGYPVAVTPARYLDTRVEDNDGIFDADDNPQDLGSGQLAADGTYELTVAGRGDVPADAKAVILNVVAAQPEGPGFLAVFPCESASDEVPLASNVNYVSGSDFSNGVTTGVGSTGNVCINTSTTTDLVVDVNAFIPADGTPEPLTPFRIVDTRTEPGDTTVDGMNQGEGPFDAGETIEYQVAGRNDIPEDITSVFVNVAAVDTNSNGYLTVFPCTDDGGVPTASNVNFEMGDTVANSVQVPLTEDGTVCVFSLKEADFIMDVVGYITPPVPARPAAV